MTYTLNRDGLSYELFLDYAIGEDVEPWMDADADETITLLAAWDDTGAVFQLTDEEISDAEEYIRYRV